LKNIDRPTGIAGGVRKPSYKKSMRNAVSNIAIIRDYLVNKTFTTSPYSERIVHGALMNVIAPIWEKLFISDSYACREGKGIRAGSVKTMEYARRNKYVLKCGISKFYPVLLRKRTAKKVRRRLAALYGLREREKISDESAACPWL
jgi:hypothetical protein